MTRDNDSIWRASSTCTSMQKPGVFDPDGKWKIVKDLWMPEVSHSLTLCRR